MGGRPIGGSAYHEHTTRLHPTRLDRLLIHAVDVDPTGLCRPHWNSTFVDDGRWFFPERRCPQMVRKFDRLDTHSYPVNCKERPSSCPCWFTITSPSTDNTTCSISDCKCRRNTLQQSCRLRQICHVAEWCPPVPILIASRLNSPRVKVV